VPRNFSWRNLARPKRIPVEDLSRTGQMQIRTRGELEQLGDALLEPLFPVARGIRLLGISMSSLAAEQAEQPEFSLPI
jgi:DNA polymerase-4